jgi:hypothetical protein
MRCWIGFGISTFATFAFPVIMALAGMSGAVKFQFKVRYTIYALIVLLASWISRGVWGMSLNGMVFFSIEAINIFLVLSIADKEKETLLQDVIKWLGIIIIPSIFIYFVSMLFDVSSPITIIPKYGDEIAEQKSLFYNFIVLIRPIVSERLIRFSGPFLEPGDYGCAVAFLMYAANFDFKKYPYLKPLAAGVLCSVSLAGYLLVGIGYVLNRFSQGKMSLKTTILISSFVLAFYGTGKYYNGGSNFINEKIISRLMTDEELGFVGNNRATAYEMKYYLDMLHDSHLFWFGYDSETVEYIHETMQMVGAGYVSMMIQVGFIGIIGLCLPYFYFAITSSKKKYAFSFFVLFLLYMFQRCDSTWIVFVISYVYGIRFCEIDNHNIIKK